MTETRLNELATAIDGEVIVAADPTYDDHRAVWNGRFDRRPSMIVRAANAGDVGVAIGFARNSGLEFAVKCGGHSNAGHSTSDGGLLLDLSLMKGVSIDPSARAARVEPGVRWGEFNPLAEAHGLAAVGGTVSTVGVAGFTLGGGSGYLTRKHGLAVDNLLSARLVTADGRQVVASETENPDLFWALRGGGGNFGVVTAFEFGLHEVGPQVFAGQIIHPFERAGDLIRLYRDFMSSAPDDCQCYAFFLRIPPIDVFPQEHHGRLVVDFVVFHLDPGPGGPATFQRLLDLEDPILSSVGPQSYSAVMAAFDAGLPPGQRYDSRAHFLDELTDEAVDTIIEHMPGMVGAFTVAYLDCWGGAVTRVDRAATAFPHRDAACAIHLMPGWTGPEQDDEVTTWTEAFHAAMAPFSSGAVYINLLGEGEEHRVRAGYGGNYERLADVKTKWDPGNFFSSTYNVSPA